MSLAFCVFVHVWRGVSYISVHYGCLRVSPKGDLLSGCGLKAAGQELSHWLPPFVHTSATNSTTKVFLGASQAMNKSDSDQRVQ